TTGRKPGIGRRGNRRAKCGARRRIRPRIRTSARWSRRGSGSVARSRRWCRNTGCRCAMLPDTSDIDGALVSKLLNDTTLAGLMPDGVYYGLATTTPTGKPPQRFVLVSQIVCDDVGQFGPAQGRCAYQDLRYLVKAVELSSVGNNIKAAAAR